jgi:hypothetical protein
MMLVLYVYEYTVTFVHVCQKTILEARLPRIIINEEWGLLNDAVANVTAETQKFKRLKVSII